MAIAGMAFRRPSDTDLEGWFHLAVQMDQNCAVDEAFHVSHWQLHISTSAMNHTPMISQPALPTTAARFAHSNLSPGNPVPMDIDAAWKVRATPDTCRYCGKTGHWVKDCDLCFDDQYMDTDELERELENKFATKDVASMEPPEEAEPLVSIEDFVFCSG